MSSILKALKKIESELLEKSEIQLRQKETDAQKIIHKPITENLRLKKQYFAIFVAIILATGGGMVLGRKPWVNISPRLTKPEIKPSKPVSRITKKTAVRDLSQKKKSANSVSEKIPVSTLSSNKEPVHLLKPPEKNPASVTKTKIMVPKSLISDQQKIAGQNLIQKDIQTKGKDEESGQNSKNKRILSIPIKPAGESNLQLQAIAWSHDSKNRIAVINGHVIREGESIERVLVTHIGKNEVIFKKGREEWKQLFRYK
jgi:hypothetical protein